MSFQWQFVPILNPDGYAQTHKEGSGKGEGEVGLEDLFRMHRKNMRPKSAMNVSEEMMARCDDEGEVAYLIFDNPVSVCHTAEPV